MAIEVSASNQPAAVAEPATILVSLELSQKDWVITIQPPGVPKMSRHSIKAGDTDRLLGVLRTLRSKAERRTGARVSLVSIQEAGLDGFWLHRWLEANEIESHVVDAASIAAPRRKRRAKTDGIDGETLNHAIEQIPSGYGLQSAAAGQRFDELGLGIPGEQDPGVL